MSLAQPTEEPSGPEVAVVGIITHRSQLTNMQPMVLLTKRKPKGHAPGMWHTPGGGVKFRESEKDALIREIREEIGVVVELLSDQPEYVTRAIFEEPYPRDVLALHYRLRLVSGTPRPLDGTEDVSWFTMEDVREKIASDTILASSVASIRHVLRWNV